MNRKFISAILLSALAVSCMTGCGENAENENSVSDSASSTSKSSDEEKDLDDEIASLEKQAMEEVENQTTSAVSAKAEPLQEILDADFSSGLVQIGNDIFKNGGYMTVNEFIAEYGDRYDTSDIDTSKSVPEGWVLHQYVITNRETEKQISLMCTEPVAKTGTVGEAVIICFRPSGATDVWYPTGINMSEKPAEMTTDDMNKIYEDNGGTFLDTSESDTKISYRTFNTAENIGKYTVIHLHENNTSSIMCQTLSEPNLYGINPMIISSFETNAFEGQEPYNYFYYRDIYYADGKYESFVD